MGSYFVKGDGVICTVIPSEVEVSTWVRVSDVGHMVDPLVSLGMTMFGKGSLCAWPEHAMRVS